MINSGTQIRKAIISAIKTAVTPVPVYSIMPPDSVMKYILVQNMTENALDEKRAFLNQGFISISIVEKFTGRDGDFDAVNDLADIIINAITPDRLNTFGNVDYLNIFSLRFESNTESLFDTSPGRTAIKSLRLAYFVQST
jgi:hypothetical protein